MPGFMFWHPESACGEDDSAVVFVVKEGRAIGCGLQGCGGVGPHPGQNAPLIVDFWRRDPDGEWKAQIIREAVGGRLVERTDGVEAFCGGGITTEPELIFSQRLTEMIEVPGGKSVGVGAWLAVFPIEDFEDFADVDEGVAGHDEGELSLAAVGALDDGNQKGAGVEDGDEGGEPALGVVLGTVVAKNWVGDVRLEDLGRPSLPLLQEVDEGFFASFEGVAANEFGRVGRGTGARVEKGYADLPAGEGLIQNGKVADDESDKTEANTGLEDDDGSCEQAVWNDVSQAEGEEGCAADVEVSAELGPSAVGVGHHGVAEGGMHGEVEQPEAGDQENRPEEEEQKKGERAVDTVNLRAEFFVGDAVGHEDPREPGGYEEDAGDSKSSGRPAGKDDGLEGVEGDSQAKEQTGDKCDDVQIGIL